MNRLKKYWWGFKFALRTFILWYIAFGIGIGMILYIIDSAGGGDIAKTLVVLPLTGVFLWKVGAKIKLQWPPSEEKIKKEKNRTLTSLLSSSGGGRHSSRTSRSSRGSGGSVKGYTCENCGTTLYDDWKIVLTSQGYSCENCNARLENQTEAAIVHGEREEDDGSNPAPWDDDYGDPAPWDDDYGDPAPWDDDFGDSAPWDDDDSW
jgi:DNA-directed RNA polymerase subunit RPC12/RpoP